MRVLVTGASRGIGKALVDHYHEAGREVHGLSSSECDLANWDRTSEYFDREVFEELDLVVHCAAVNATKFFRRMTHDAFREMVDINIIGTFNLLQCVIPRLRKHGSVILFSSVSAFSPRIGQAAYACCKSALHGLVRVLYQEMLAEEKYIFVIAPGMVETGMPMAMMSESAREKAREVIPMRRFCRITELSEAIEFLHRTPYMTGQTIHINGGYYVQ